MGIPARSKSSSTLLDMGTHVCIHTTCYKHMLARIDFVYKQEREKHDWVLGNCE